MIVEIDDWLGLENRQGGSPALEGSTPSPSSKCLKSNAFFACKADKKRLDVEGTTGTKGAQNAPHAPQKRPTVRREKTRAFRRLFSRETTRALPIPELSPEFSTKFWERVSAGSNSDCWNWTGATSSFGYGRVKIGGRLYSTHRIAYTFSNGTILNLSEYHGAVVRHSCDNPACCNPAHLCIGDQRANVHDMVARGRHSNGGGAV